MFDVLCFFTSTKGHYGRDTYQYTSNDLFKKSFLIRETFTKVAHIKVSPGEEAKHKEMKEWLLNKGFNHVIESYGNWKHNDISHGSEYLKDIAKMFDFCRHHQFGLWLEDDFIFHNEDLDKDINFARELMDKIPDVRHFRWTRKDQFDNIERTAASLATNNLYGNRSEFSFNPCFINPSIQSLISKYCLMHNPHPHCEMAYTISNLRFSSCQHPFVFQDNHVVEHIGTEQFIKENNL